MVQQGWALLAGLGLGRVQQQQAKHRNHASHNPLPKVYPDWTRQMLVFTMHIIHLNVSICVVKSQPIC